MKTIQEKVESIMHMVVNFGEQPSYSELIKMLANEVGIEMFGTGYKNILILYFQSKFTVEVLEHMEEYGAESNEAAADMIRELTECFIDHV